jgi:hypothetical protein
MIGGVSGRWGPTQELVPRRGLEPPRLSPLVPETSASTNSATWARRVSYEPSSQPVNARGRPKLSGAGFNFLANALWRAGDQAGQSGGS